MQYFTRCILILTVCLSVTSSFAWGRRGHEIVAEIAFNYLDSTDKAKILSYLGHMSLTDAANWLDEVRNDPKYSSTAPWHYVDFPKGTSYHPADQSDIISALTHIMNELDGRQIVAGQQIREDLLALIHLIGDLNQPLHVGYPDDKGGNLYQVSFLGKGSNLHRVWDSEIIEEKNISFDSCYALARRITDIQKRVPLVPVTDATLLSWMNATRELTEGVYPSGHKIDQAYIDKQAQVIERQLAIAGIELWKALHEIAQHINVVQFNTVSVPEEVTSQVSLTDLNSHIGKTVHVYGKVFGVKYMSGGGKYTFVNVGAPYPDAPLTLFITEEVRNKFSYKPEETLDGRNICVTGKPEMYKGKPEIVIREESEIEMKESL